MTLTFRGSTEVAETAEASKRLSKNAPTLIRPKKSSADFLRIPDYIVCPAVMIAQSPQVSKVP